MTMTIGLTMLIGLNAANAAVAPQPEPCSTMPAIALTWIDPDKLLPQVNGLSKRVKTLFADAGVDVHWQVYRGRRDSSRDHVQVHIYLRSSEPTAWKLGPHAMGVTFHNRVRAERVYLFFPAIARTLGWRPEALRSLLQRRSVTSFERALSRVIAHEVVHAVQPLLEHGRSGITRGRLSRPMLLTAEIGIEEQTRQQICAVLATFNEDQDHATLPGLAGQ